MNTVNILNGQRLPGSQNVVNVLNGQTVPDSEMIRTYDIAILSGAPVLLRFFSDEGFKYVKTYPTISAAVSGTVDASLDNPYGYQDAELSGSPVVYGFVSGGKEYYSKAYPVPGDTIFIAGDLNFRPRKYADAALSGTPRIAKVTVSGTAYYFAVYPVKT